MVNTSVLSEKPPLEAKPDPRRTPPDQKPVEMMHVDEQQEPRAKQHQPRSGPKPRNQGCDRNNQKKQQKPQTIKDLTLDFVQTARDNQ